MILRPSALTIVSGMPDESSRATTEKVVPRSIPIACSFEFAIQFFRPCGCFQISNMNGTDILLVLITLRVMTR